MHEDQVDWEKPWLFQGGGGGGCWLGHFGLFCAAIRALLGGKRERRDDGAKSIKIEYKSQGGREAGREARP